MSEECDGKILEATLRPESLNLEIEGGTWILARDGIRFRWDDGSEIVVASNMREDEE